MPANYTVSAIISLFKGEKFIRGRLDDLLAQTLGDKVEIVIIDSNSPQNEKQIIDEYLPAHPNIKYVRTDFIESMYAAWNRGISISSGKYVTNANADDRLAPNALERLVQALEEDTSAGLVYADYFISPVENEDFETAKRSGRPIKQSGTFSMLRLLSGYMCGPQSLWRRSLHDEHNILFDDSFEVTGDYKFVVDVSEVTGLKYLPETLGVYYRSQADENKEFQNLEKTLGEAFKIKYELVNFMLDNGAFETDPAVAKNLKLYPNLPVKISSVLWRLSSDPVLNYELIYWISAVSAERAGNYREVKRIIRKFRNLPGAKYISNYEKFLTAKGVI